MKVMKRYSDNIEIVNTALSKYSYFKTHTLSENLLKHKSKGLSQSLIFFFFSIFTKLFHFQVQLSEKAKNYLHYNLYSTSS